MMRQLFSAPRIFTATGGEQETLVDSAVLVDAEGRIEAIGKTLDLRQKGMSETQLDGVLLPGLLDVHTHLCLSASMDPFGDALAEHPARMTLRAVAALGAHIDAGVTTIRDVGGLHGIDLEMQHLVDDDSVEGPAVFAAGKLIAMTGGHACMLGFEVDGEDAVRAAARQNLKDGARLLKIIATGGVLTKGVRPGAQQLSEHEMRAAVEEAQKVGKTVAAHAQGADGIDAALRAGVNTIEHGFWLSDYALERLCESGRALVPTLAAIRCMERLGEALPESIQEKLKTVATPHEDSIRRAHARGCCVATGTDAGTPGNPHGNIGVELAALHELGFGPEECWRAATANGAKALSLKDRGELCVGKRADLIAISDESFDGVLESFRPHFVMRGGRRLR
jgi:imidazolonepropionase-like amidohydrolase